VVAQVGQARRAQPAAARALLYLVEGLALLAHPPRDLVEGEARALATGHGAGPGSCLADADASFHVAIIMKSIFSIKQPGESEGVVAGDGTVEWGMPEALDVTCPCCEAQLKVDPETGSVVWADKKKVPPKDFDDLVSRVQSQKSAIDQKFARSVQHTRRSSEILEKKFEEARKRAEADPTTKAPHPFDND
jgi:hypothetical protein